MPALKLLGRRWNVASDDVPAAAFFPTLYHGIWTVILFVCWLVLDQGSNCSLPKTYTAALAGLGVSFLLSFALGVWVIVEGLRGTIFEVSKRRRVPPLVFAMFAMFVVEIVFVVFATVLIRQPAPECTRYTRHLWSKGGVMSGLIWSTWAIISLGMIGSALAYNAFPNYDSRSSWEHRCRCLTGVCCCRWRAVREGDVNHAPYARLAELFLQLFGHTDLTLTDVLAAFLMLAEWQREGRQEALNAILGYEGPDVDDDDDPEADRAGKDDDEAEDAEGDGEEDEDLDDEGSSTSDSAMLGSSGPDAGHLPAARQLPEGQPFLLTPSGLFAQHKPTLDPGEAAERQGLPKFKVVGNHDLKTAAHFCNYAFAAYGYMLYIWSQPSSKLANLCCGRWCGLWTGPLRRYAQAFSMQRIMPDLAITNHMNYEAILQMAGLKEENLLFVRYERGSQHTECLPYYIALDHETKSVVLGIRGTLSLDDCLTDFMCEPADMDAWIKENQAHEPHEGRAPHQEGMSRPSCSSEDASGPSSSSGSRAQEEGLCKPQAPPNGGPRQRRTDHDRHKQRAGTTSGITSGPGKKHHHGMDTLQGNLEPPGTFLDQAPSMNLAKRESTQTAHAGILAAARAIVRDLQSHHMLSKLLLPDSEPAQAHQASGAMRQRIPDCRGWRLVLTGHSLGAGAALLVGLYLRNYFPHVRVWAFEPPGGLAGPHLAEAVQDFATSVVLGKDWIPRLTLKTFERLRDEMITAAVQCRLSKFRFLWGALFGARYRARRRQKGRSLFSPAHEAPPEATKLVHDWSKHLEHTSSSARARYEIAREFCVAGRIMFMRPVKRKARVKRKTRRYQPIWISPEDLLQEGILVSPRMMADHMPDYLTAVMRRTTAARGQPVTNSEVVLDVEEHAVAP